MTEDNKLTEWQRRDFNILQGALKQDDFNELIEVMDALWDEAEPDKRSGALLRLLSQFGLPWGTRKCVEHYARTGELDPRLIEPSILIESEKDGTIEPSDLAPEIAKWIQDQSRRGFGLPEVRLILRPETTRAELDEFLNRYWSSAIKKRLRSLEERKQYRTSPNAKRDNEVQRLKQSGKSNSEIADILGDEEHPLTADEIRIILHRKK